MAPKCGSALSRPLLPCGQEALPHKLSQFPQYKQPLKVPRQGRLSQLYVYETRHTGHAGGKMRRDDIELSPYEYVVLNQACHNRTVYPPPTNIIPHGVYRGLAARGLIKQDGVGWTITQKGRTVFEAHKGESRRRADMRFCVALAFSQEGRRIVMGVNTHSDMTVPARIDRPPTYVPGRGD